MKLTSILFLAAGLAILLGIVALNPPISIIANADPVLIFAGLIISTMSAVLWTMKWRSLLPAPFRILFPVQMAGNAISSLSPGRAAEPIKAFMLKSKIGISVSSSLPTIIWERIIDLIVLLIFSFLLVFGPSIIPEGFSYLAAVGAVIVAGIIVLLFSILKFEAVGKLVARLMGKIKIQISKEFLGAFYANGGVSVRRLVSCFVFATLAWSFQAAVLYLSLAALGAEVPIITAVGIFGCSFLIGLATMLPGGIGTVELSSVILLGAAGIAAPTATAAVVLSRLLTFWYAVMIGGLSFVAISRS